MLWLDIGNSRIKWLLQTPVEEISGAFSYRNVEEFSRAPLWSLLRSDVSVWASSVANNDIRDRVEAFCADSGSPMVQWAKPQRENNRLKNSYQDVARMGVDRWLAMLAAWSEQQKAVMVIDAGSAITVDWVDDQGQHLGGHIVPGLNLLTQSLSKGTANVKFDAQLWSSIAPGQSTDMAVFQGVLAMAVGYIESLLRQNSKESPMRVFITGGDALTLQKYIKSEMFWRPNLVIEGLMLYAKGEH